MLVHGVGASLDDSPTEGTESLADGPSGLVAYSRISVRGIFAARADIESSSRKWIQRCTSISQRISFDEVHPSYQLVQLVRYCLLIFLLPQAVFFSKE